jgi:hypothetical protein
VIDRQEARHSCVAAGMCVQIGMSARFESKGDMCVAIDRSALLLKADIGAAQTNVR